MSSISSSNDNTIALAPIDITLACSDGMTLAAQKWKPAPFNTGTNGITEPINTEKYSRKILCVHGWMDNCRSYHYFAPNVLGRLQMNLAKNTTTIDDIEIVTIDLPGHGWSSHKSLDGPPVHIADYVYYISEALQQLQWNAAVGEDDTCASNNTEIVLVGHSMGAAICSMYAATFPEHIQKLVLLEGGTYLCFLSRQSYNLFQSKTHSFYFFPSTNNNEHKAGPMTRPGNEFTKHLRENILQRQKQQPSPMVKPPRIYPTLHQAITTRMLTVKKFPGQQYISEATATELVVRGTRAIQERDTTTATTTDKDTAMIVGYQFRHDPRLQLPSIQYCTEEQVEAIYTNIQCPIALLLAQDGWPMSNAKKQETMIQETIQPKVFKTLPGSHHFHSDPDTAEAVVEVVVNFLGSK